MYYTLCVYIYICIYIYTHGCWNATSVMFKHGDSIQFTHILLVNFLSLRVHQSDPSRNFTPGEFQRLPQFLCPAIRHLGYLCRFRLDTD